MSKGIWVNDKTFVRFSDEKTSLTEKIATRKGAIDFYSLGMYLPNPDPVLKKQGKDITVYNELLTDAHLGGCVTSRKSGVLSMEWSIDRGKAKSRQAKLIEDVFRGLDIRRITSEILNAPLYGYQVLEVIWENSGSYILPKSVEGKPQEWFVFGEENDLRLRTKANYNGEPVPDKKFLLVQHEATYKNPYGFPLLSRCFWPITFKRGGMKFWVIFSEKYGMPFLIGKHPRGTSQQETDKLAEMLEAMVQDAVAVIPDDSSVEIQEAGGKAASADIYDRLLSYCDTQSSIAILGQNLTTQVEGGSYAATKSHMQVRKDIIDADRQLVELTFNQLIKWIAELNFNTYDKLPVFSMWEEEDVDRDLAERDKLLVDAGVRFTKEYWRKAYGFEEGDIAAVSAPQPQPGPQYAEATPSRVFDAQKQIESLIDTAMEKPGLDLTPLYRIIDESSSYEELQRKIAEAYKDIDMSQFREILSRAMFMADLRGRSLGA